MKPGVTRQGADFDKKKLSYVMPKKLKNACELYLTVVRKVKGFIFAKVCPSESWL
jgi:hypothetical protein